MAASRPAGQQDRVQRLMTVRDQLSSALDSCDSKRDLAALSREYRAVLTELEALQPPTEKRSRGVDEIGRRRAAKRSADPEDQGLSGGVGG